MNTNIKPSDSIAIVGNIEPASKTANTYSTGWISAAMAAWFLAEIQLGALATNSTVNAKLEQAQDGTGTGVKDITGKAITELSEAGTDDSNKLALINLNAEDLDNANAFTHFRLSITVATAAAILGAKVTAHGLRNGHAPAANLAAVSEIV